MSRQYNLQFIESDSGLTFSGVMTVDTATNVVTDLYELSDPTMKNLMNSTSDPRVTGNSYPTQYRYPDQAGYNPDDLNTYVTYNFQDGGFTSTFDNVYDISYGTTIIDDYLPFDLKGLWVNSLGSDIDAYAKQKMINSTYSSGYDFSTFGYIITVYYIATYSGDGDVGFEMLSPSNFSITPFNVSCFTRNTKITTADGEVAIQNIRMGTLIPTLSSGLKEVVEIGVRNIKTFPDIEDVGLQIYRYEDGLRVTGKHSVLVDELTEEQEELIPSIIGSLKQTEGKWLLPACIDPYAEQLEASGMFTVYHLVLENDDDDGNYGIVAHNTWVETCSKNDFEKYVRL